MGYLLSLQALDDDQHGRVEAFASTYSLTLCISTTSVGIC